MTTTAKIQPLTIDQVGCDAEHFGVKVTVLGEDGDQGWMVFTDDWRRAVAALHRHIRVDLNSGPVKRMWVDPCEWVLVYGNCGCGDTCRCKVVKAKDGSYTDHVCLRWGLPPCVDDVFSYRCERASKDTPGAVPTVTLAAVY